MSSLNWLSDKEVDEADLLELTAQFSFTSADAVKRFRDALAPGLAAKFGRDPRIAVSDTRHPFNASFGVFGTRRMAHELIGVDALHKANARGQGVNVVVVDMGVEANWVRATRRRFGAKVSLDQQVHGWSRHDPKWDEKAKKWIRNPLESGQVAGRTLSEHGAMVARCILGIAPEARIWDVPLLGDAENPPGLATSTALLNRIRAFKKDGDGRFWWEEDPTGKPKEELDELRAKFREMPWVVVNAWGVVDTGMLPANDWKDDSLEYGDHPDHFLVNDAPAMEDAGIDVLFCATNCGEPGPDTRCAAENCGPGCGIMGVNAHPSVLTVGAVRADGVPIAQSSQGPGRLARK